MICKDDDWKLTYSSEITHKMKSTISAMAWINDSVLATASLDKTIMFWNFPQKKLLNTATSK